MPITQQSLHAEGQSYRDFQITKYLPLEELQSTLIELVHEPTGACVIHLANADPENLFCLSFQTLPDSSNGVAHILEHTVLCGSKNFPVKDPFFSMTRRSLNTFMNALTGQDFTCYPAASQVEKDFYNLLEVYLDAVFHPNLNRLSFLQEGHRLAFAEAGNLEFRGIVYNEMKGALSSGEERLWEILHKHLLPDLPYAYNSGGDPKEIPKLTYEEFVEFHRNFYHPSRCIFFFYGNLPLVKHLDFIAENALESVQKISPLPPLPRQKRFTAPVVVTDRYPTTDLSQQDFIALSWLTTSLTDQGEVLALSLLDSLLMDTDASPLKKALLRSGLCADAYSSLDTEMSEIPWTIIFRECKGDNAEKLRSLTLKTIEKLAKTPFSKEDVEASLHQLEFHRKEIGAEGVPYGLTLFFRGIPLKQHGSDAENGLMIHRLFSELRERLEDPSYLPNLLKKYTLDNPHSVLLTLKADASLEKEEKWEEQKRLEEISAQLSQEEKKEILLQTEKLALYQEAIEHQSLECLPKLSLSDIPPHAKDFSLSETASGVFHHPCFTNEILYADLVLDLPEISPAELPLLPLFTRFLTELGCGGRNYEENLAYQQASVGSLYGALSLYVSQEDPNVLQPTFILKGKALLQHADKLFELFSDFLSSPDFSDERRIRELLTQHASSLQSRLPRKALHYAVQTAVSGFSLPSFIQNQWSGLPYYRQVLTWARKFPENLPSELQRLHKRIFEGVKADLVLSCGKKEFEEVEKREFFGCARGRGRGREWGGDIPLTKVPSQARFIAAPVSFSTWGMRTASYRDPQSPFLLLAAELLENCYLHREIREKGGAYGGGASYSPATGNFCFHANRDPHLARTALCFQQALEKIAAGKFEERDLEEAKFNVLQSLDAPVPPGERASLAYSWKRTGRTFALRDSFRKTILKAEKGEVTKAVSQLLEKEKVFVTLTGKELFQHQEEKFKESLIIIEI